MIQSRAMTKRKKGFLESEAWAAFRKEYESADDRSCALLCASYLENCLEVLVAEALAHPDKAKAELLAETMPLGTFSAKIKMALCLNIIDEMTFSDLNCIRKIRNEFAHGLHGLTFTADPIRSWCSALQFPEDSRHAVPW